MTLAILATGDELIHGDTLNTNTRDLAHSLSSEGIPLGLQMVCSDKKAHLVQCLQFLVPDHHIIILIGGLGPTSDDLTRFALAEFLGEDLIQHAAALEHVQARLTAAGVAMNAGNLQQCLFPANAQLLFNPNGSALGCYYAWQEKIFILLPGPPSECLPMFQQQVLPLLQQSHHSHKQLLTWRIFGLAESEIAETLEEALLGLNCQTGYRLETPYIEFKVRCKPEKVAEVRAVIEPIIKPHLITADNQKASDALLALLLKKNKAITIIDEVTGGLLERLLAKPNTRDLIQWHARSNTDFCFELEGLKNYWRGEAPGGKTELSIRYHYQGQTGQEEHILPYRSASVVYYAAEWLSARLLHLINQCHQSIAQ